MKALVHTESLRLEHLDMPAPAPGPSDVLVRVASVAICGSDVHGYTGTTGRRIPPIVMGHEASGVVEEVGSSVRGWRQGERVTFDSTVFCNDCPNCRAGRVNLCERREILGVSTPTFRRHGAMAELVAVPNWILHRLPDELSFDEAALVEPTAVAMHAVRLTAIEAGEPVVVVGAGAIGILATQAAKAAGAGTVVVVDLRDDRLELARGLGASAVINPEVTVVEEALAEAIGRRTAPAVIEAVGIGRTVQLAMDLTSPGGRLTLVGNVQPSVEMHLQSIVSKELTIRGSAASAGEYPESIALIASGRIRTRPLISRTMPLAAGQEAFDLLRTGDRGLMKIVLRPNAGLE